MKKRIITLFSIILLAACTTIHANSFEVDGIAVNGGTLLPIREASKQIGYETSWQEGQAQVSGGGVEATIQIGETAFTINGTPGELSAPPVLINGLTYAPVDFFESFDSYYINTTSPESASFTKRGMADGGKMMGTITALSANPRGANEPGLDMARNFITEAFNSYGFITEKQEFEYEAFNWDTMESSQAIGINIIATKKPGTPNPTNDILIIGAHYDAEIGVPAANDNASGTAVMLEVARIVSSLPTDTELRFIAFDAEEQGLIGSSQYVNTLPPSDLENIVGMVNFDMLAGAKAENVEIYTTNGESNYLFEIITSNYKYAHHEPKTLPMGGSDHMSFFPKAIPDICFSHPAIRGEYHSEDDSVENISEEMLIYAAEAGYTAISKATSNLSPTYKTIAKPVFDETVTEIPNNLRLPFNEPISEFARITGMKLTQSPTGYSSAEYKSNIKILGLDNIFAAKILSYSGNTASNLSIDLKNTGTECSALIKHMTEILGAPEEYAQGSGTNYLFTGIYGNDYMITDDPMAGVFEMEIYANHGYENREGYTLKDGNLVRMETTQIGRQKLVIQKGGKTTIKVINNVPSKTLPVSGYAIKSWERVKAFLTEEEAAGIQFITVSTDGVGGQKGVVITNQEEQRRDEAAAESSISSDENGGQESISYTYEYEPGITISLDYLDITHVEANEN
ncbi:MAG: M28 family peptidase [Clostridiales bacterium]|nr:M28 family peptidase [Clostridiales bacterium]